MVAPLRTTARLLFFGWGRKTAAAAARGRQEAAQQFIQETVAGLGGNSTAGDFSMRSATSSDCREGQCYQGVTGGALAKKQGLVPQLKAAVSGEFATQNDIIDDILRERPESLTGPKRLPVIYEVEARRRAQQSAVAEQHKAMAYNKDFDEWNMPRCPDDPKRVRAKWEFTPTLEHRALVLLLYRNILKGLMEFKSIRKRSMIAYARFAFRRRAMATEKLLIDECIEESRRAIYVLEKHRNFTHTRSYEFDTMTLPKDTGQDVKTYMEEVYDPEVSRMQFQNFMDVQPGREHLHQQGLGPSSGENHWKKQKSCGRYEIQIRDEDKALRPPPPPGMSN